MKKSKEIINEFYTKKEWKKILINILRETKQEHINTLLTTISNSKKLTKQEKFQYYHEIFDYVEEVNAVFEKKTREIYMNGVRDTLLKVHNEQDITKKKE